MIESKRLKKPRFEPITGVPTRNGGCTETLELCSKASSESLCIVEDEAATPLGDEVSVLKESEDR
jgi:hypothetical protein